MLRAWAYPVATVKCTTLELCHINWLWIYSNWNASCIGLYCFYGNTVGNEVWYLWYNSGQEFRSSHEHNWIPSADSFFSKLLIMLLAGHKTTGGIAECVLRCIWKGEIFGDGCLVCDWCVYFGYLGKERVGFTWEETLAFGSDLWSSLEHLEVAILSAELGSRPTQFTVSRLAYWQSIPFPSFFWGPLSIFQGCAKWWMSFI